MEYERQVLQENIQVKLDKLDEIWVSVGIDEDQRQGRCRTAMKHVGGLLDEMIEEEQSMKYKIQEKIASFESLLLKLCQELRIEPYEPPAGLSMIATEKSLRLKANELNKVKGDRMEKLHELKKNDQYLCDVLQMTPFYIPTGSVPSNEQLQALHGHITALQTEKEERSKVFQAGRSEIKVLMEKLERAVDTSFERDILCDEEDSFLLSSNNMKALAELQKDLEAEHRGNKAKALKLRDDIKTLWERLQIGGEDREQFCSETLDDTPTTIKKLEDEVVRCEELKLANIKQVIEGARKQLHDWWDKCFFTEEQRNVFTPLHSDIYSEELLVQHDSELEEVKKYYQDSAEMFDKVARWKTLWDAFQEFEKKASNPDRFFNRGCNLLKEEKARKKLMRELPKVEEELIGEIEEYEKAKMRDFMVGGVRFVDFIKKNWEEYHAMKENEKKLRVKARAKETESEMIYGSKPVTTPNKRRFHPPTTTPGRTPNKMRKLNETPKTPGSVSRLANRSKFTSTFASPASYMTRSGSKTPRTPRHTPYGRNGKGLSEKNTNVVNDSAFSSTTISGGSTTLSTTNGSSTSIASIGPYKDFATCLNGKTRSQCRSSVAPRPAFF